jgi:hypothetical protein
MGRFSLVCVWAVAGTAREPITSTAPKGAINARDDHVAVLNMAASGMGVERMVRKAKYTGNGCFPASRAGLTEALIMSPQKPPSVDEQST